MPVWLVVGLGARGLVYHAWLGKIVAAAVLNQSESQVPSELLSWRQGINTQPMQSISELQGGASEAVSSPVHQ